MLKQLEMPKTVDNPGKITKAQEEACLTQLICHTLQMQLWMRW